LNPMLANKPTFLMTRPSPLWLIALAIVAAILVTSCKGDSASPAEEPSPGSTIAASPTPVAFHLQVLTQECRTEDASGMVIVEGTARNVSGQDLSGTIARASFLTDAQTLVSKAEAPVSGNTTGAGGIVAFRVNGADDPAVTQCFVQFVRSTGEPLNVDYSRVRIAATATP